MWRTSSSSNTLMNNFAALIIFHTFMCHFLVAITSVFVHLMTFCNPITVSKSSLRLRLVSFCDRIAASVSFGRGYHLHFGKPPFAHAACIHWDWLCHLLLYIVSHTCNHFVNLTERFLEERVICEWIPKFLQHWPHSEIFHHLVCHLLMSGHHWIEGRNISMPRSHLIVVVCETVLGLICHCEGPRSFLVKESHWASL